MGGWGGGQGISKRTPASQSESGEFLYGAGEAEPIWRREAAPSSDPSRPAAQTPAHIPAEPACLDAQSAYALLRFTRERTETDALMQLRYSDYCEDRTASASGLRRHEVWHDVAWRACHSAQLSAPSRLRSAASKALAATDSSTANAYATRTNGASHKRESARSAPAADRVERARSLTQAGLVAYEDTKQQ